jgi:hypothetical protein
MKATLLFESHQLFVTKSGGTVEIHMDLYKVECSAGHPGSEFRFSWIAFDSDNPMRRVLFDSHPPKGPHFHVDNDSKGQPFAWVSIPDAIQLFRKTVEEHFGKLEAIPNNGGHE